MSADPVQIIIAITGLMATLFILLKSVHTISTPCFKITVNGTEQDANIISYLTHRFTPRTVEQAANITTQVVKDVEKVADEATSSKK